jgi:hypothetical protein
MKSRVRLFKAAILLLSACLSEGQGGIVKKVPTSIQLSWAFRENPEQMETGSTRVCHAARVS